MGAPLIQLVTPGTVLVAAGQRLARHLAQQYARECRAARLEVWETPAILTFGAWLNSLWQEAIETGADARLLLTPVQAAALWERVIGAAQHDTQLLSAAATARPAERAWMLMHAWRLPREQLGQTGHEDVRAFATWAGAFERTCRDHDCIDAARLANLIAGLIVARRIRVPQRVVLAGFDELTPQQARLVEALSTAGCSVDLHQPATRPGRAVRVALPAAEDEIVAAAHWARARLGANPAVRLGVLAPDLAGQARTIRRVFDDVLLPAALLPGNAEATRPYNVSFGEALAAQPMVGAALAVLEFAGGTLALSRVTELLHSPYLAGGDTELTQRAALDVELRRIGDVELSIGALAFAIKRSNSCPILAERLARFRALARPRAQAPSAWLGAIAELLASLGWPGERARSSTEHQVIEAWRELLRAFGALDAVLGKIDYGAALSRLRRLAQETLFQRETPETPVQILGVNEAGGFEFDALWIMGLHDEVWPAASKPSPFLPIALQRRHRVPHSSAERELEFCLRQTQRLLGCAAEIVCSHPRREEDRDLRASPLIQALPEIEPQRLAPAPPRYVQQVQAAARLEAIADDQAPALPAGTMARGGTALFKAQSACPFRAFAEFRLCARPLEEPEPGLDPRERGNLVHEMLNRIWQQLGTHAQLVARSREQIDTSVHTAAAEVVKRLQQRRPTALTERLAGLERGRLAALACEWLELEKQRAPFAVRHEETKVSLQVGALRTEARIDRVDQLDDGSFVVIDYKTGEPKTSDWFGERPAEPQLPLYALYGMPRERVSALLFGKARKGESKFVGLARASNIVPRVEAHDGSRLALQQGPWQTLLDKWEVRFLTLAEEHRAGVARVSPRERQVCDTCHLHAFCRVHERRARLVDVGEGSDE